MTLFNLKLAGTVLAPALTVTRATLAATASAPPLPTVVARAA